MVLSIIVLVFLCGLLATDRAYLQRQRKLLNEQNTLLEQRNGRLRTIISDLQNEIDNML